MLINLASKDCRSNSFPLGSSYVAAALNFCNVEIVDLNCVDSDELIQKVSNKHFDVVGISCYTGNFMEASSLAKTIIKSDEATPAQKNVCLKIKEKLSRITVDYFMDLLIHPISEYGKILNEKINAVEHYLKNKKIGGI